MNEQKTQLNTDASSPLSVPENVFRATAESAEHLAYSFPYYKSVLADFGKGEGQVELRKRFMLKGIDEAWVNAVEDALPALDAIIRNPGYMLEEKREVLPVERTRRVTDSSIQHLCQHTDLINDIRPDGTVIPSKLLNVYQDETVLTYENKFINTLVSRLYAFVARRHDAAEACGEDEKNTKLDFDRTFERDGQKGKIKLTIEVSETPREHEVVKNYVYTTDLWHRVQKLYRVVTTYMDSSFVQTMGKAYIRPPLMRTNKILKNVNFRQCLTLWEFLDSYENTGYETIVQEDLEKVGDDCLSEMYNTMAMQYVLFQSHIKGTFDKAQMLDISAPGEVIRTRFRDELQPLDERELDVAVSMPENADIEALTEDEVLLEQAITIALEADKFYVGEEADEEEELVLDEGKILYRYRYSFLARVVRAGDPLQRYYTEIKNYILSHTGVKCRQSWKHELFTLGRQKCARINVKGKTLCLYLPLDPAGYAVSKYHHVDLSAEKENVDLPLLLKVKSDRGLKYALELLRDVLEGVMHLGADPGFVPADYHMEPRSNEEMAAMVPPLVKIIGEESGAKAPEAAVPAAPAAEIPEEPPVPRLSFPGKLTLLEEPVQTYYSDLKNALLEGKKVKARQSWSHESFTLGRVKCAKMSVKGKTLCLYLPLDPTRYDASRFHHINLLERNAKTNADFPLLLKIKSNRALKYAKMLVDEMLREKGIVKNPAYVPADFHLEKATLDDLLTCNPPLAKMAKRVKVGKSE